MPAPSTTILVTSCSPNEDTRARGAANRPHATAATSGHARCPGAAARAQDASAANPAQASSASDDELDQEGHDVVGVDVHLRGWSRELTATSLHRAAQARLGGSGKNIEVRAAYSG